MAVATEIKKKHWYLLIRDRQSRPVAEELEKHELCNVADVPQHISAMYPNCAICPRGRTFHACTCGIACCSKCFVNHIKYVNSEKFDLDLELSDKYCFAVYSVLE